MPAAFSGPPGVYLETAAPPFVFSGERMDVCAFAGVAARGPARVPIDDPIERADAGRRIRRSVAVAVESFDEYRRVFGGFESAGLLPYAVDAFFKQGGTRAYVVRIVHAYGDGHDREGASVGTLPGVRTSGGGAVELRARSEGAWGDALSATLEFRVTPVLIDEARSTGGEIALAPDVVLPEGSLLRVTTASGFRRLNGAGRSSEVPLPNAPGRELRVTLASPLAAAPLAVDVVEATITVEDGTGCREVHEGLGLDPRHPRWLGRVLYEESALVWPGESWIDAPLQPADERLVADTPARQQFTTGADRADSITPDDFFDQAWVPGNGVAGDGVYALANIRDVAMVCAPDLYSPGPLPPTERVLDPPTLAGASFELCRTHAPGRQRLAAADLAGLRLDPLLPADLTTIVELQQKLVEFADQLRRFTVLLDAPPGLHVSKLLRWRRRFDSAFAAAYHPWIAIAPDNDDRDALIRVPPSAVAAGIVARQEHRFGVPHGPANALAFEAVLLDPLVSSSDHAALHAAGVNVYVRDPDGFRLTSARTLSAAASYRQLSVRRLVTQLARTLERQTQWIVFEPNTSALRRDLTRALRALLRGLFDANAFTGNTEEEAFFVRCDDELNDRRSLDAGRLVAEIGVAPAEPLEFVIVRLIRDADGRVTVEG